MAFTGEFERIGTADSFDWDDIPDIVNISLWQSLAWDGTSLFMFFRARLAGNVTIAFLSTLDRTTGVVTRVGTSENFGVSEDRFGALAWNGTELYAVLDSIGHKLYTIDRTTSVATFVADITPAVADPDFRNIEAMAWDGTTMFALETGTDALYTLDLSTGFATRVGSAVDFGLPAGSFEQEGLAWDGSDLYGVHNLPSSLRYLTTIDRTTGVATIVDASVVNFGLDFNFNMEGIEWDGTDLFVIDRGTNTSTGLYRAIPLVPVSGITTERPADAITENTFTIAYTKEDPADAEPTAAIVVAPSGNMSAFSVSTPASGSLTLTRDPMISATNPTFTASEVTVTLTFADGTTDELQLRFASVVYMAEPDAPVLMAIALASGRVRLEWNIPALNGSTLTNFQITQTGAASASYLANADAVSAVTPVLPPGDYSFSIVARSDVGPSLPSPTVSVTVLPPVSVPDRPTLSAVLNTNNTITLDWEIPALNGSLLEGFEITQTGQASNMYSTGASAITFTTGALSPGTYRFSIVANSNMGDSIPSVVRRVVVPQPAGATPLAFSRSVLVGADIGIVLGADADNDNVYLFTRQNSIDRIYTVQKSNGAVESNPAAVVFNGFNRGLAVVGTGFAYALSTMPARQSMIEVVDADGNADTSISVAVATFFLPNGLIYRQATQDYILFVRDSSGNASGTWGIPVDVDGSVGQAVRLTQHVIVFDGVARGNDRYWIAFDGSLASIPHYDLGLNALGSSQTRHSDDTDPIFALAFSLDQLIIVTGQGSGIKLNFYGAESPPVVLAGEPQRQLAIETPAFERFDIVKGDTSITEVLSVNVNAVRTTALSLVDVPGTGTLQERLALVEITPEFTVPTIAIGDKLFLHAGDPETEPTAIPTTGVFVVDDIISTGNAFRQRFVCSLES